MPFTPAQLRLFHAKAKGEKGKGPSKATAKKMLGEHAGVRTDVDRTGHAKKKPAGRGLVAKAMTSYPRGKS